MGTSVLSRRRFLQATATGAGVVLAGQKATADVRRVGPWASQYGERSPFDKVNRTISGNLQHESETPQQALSGMITPSSLHYERHHAGVPTIRPEEHKLLIHGMVEEPKVFTLHDLLRFPQASRICFLECAGNGKHHFKSDEKTTPQRLCGLISQSEWSGVSLSSLLREVGVKKSGSWLLAEGSDACLLTRSIPMERALDDVLIAYAQNGEAVRPEQGYPLRLIVPGCEGSMNVKWLRRLEVSDQPFMTREETAKYSDPLKDGTVRQFSFVMDAKSIITQPAYPLQIEKGWHEIRGLAWSGRGQVAGVEVSDDNGSSWHQAQLQSPVLDKSCVRFGLLWKWDGKERLLTSRVIDSTGYTQPSARELIAIRGKQSLRYHNNTMTTWRVQSDGQVFYQRMD
ncbi:sulfite dehydrogenase [Sansalvadorimonas sp. 2012CJ34-2]|uniref:Sulfite dehydrogenase n=1 Tax=Parendozoicomonas callyspongiae TaxID=2942213 RepID=A0ABT0PL52_9GAMM|nr:sulfite dehydrogenase [Sansalvadorimonas sp. 2012CJ34-2]MCL6271168.1 sulfite dehydrogenase [Sansalvadorimonas sp. 2012CJ34-2]